MEKQTHTLDTPDVDLVYDVVGPLPTADGRPPLLMAGHPMAAEGFFTVAEYFPERTVVVYDPRGVGRSVRKDGRTERSPELHSADVRLIASTSLTIDLCKTRLLPELAARLSAMTLETSTPHRQWAMAS